MGDLDAQGNVDNSNLPAYKPRHNANATDIRRSVGVAPKVFDVGSLTIGNFQTISDLTGVTSCVEGVEVTIHGSTNAGGDLNAFRSANYMIKLGGVTGTYSFDNDSELFNINRNHVGGNTDPLEAPSEGIFIPTTDPTKISIGAKTNSGSGLHGVSVFKTNVRVAIK